MPSRPQVSEADIPRLIKKQVQIKNMSREIERLTFEQAELKASLEPTTSKIDALQRQVNELAATYQSKMATIGEIKSTPNALTITKDMSATAVLEARKVQARLAKLELETMESEIEMLEAQILVDAEKVAAHAKVSDLEATQTKLEEMTADIVVLKSEYQKANLAWISKFSDEESTLQTTTNKDETNDPLIKLEQVSAENKALKEQIRAMLEKSIATSDEFVVGLQQAIAAGTAQNYAQATEIETLKAIISADKAQHQAQITELQSLYEQSQAQALDVQSWRAYNKSQADEIHSLKTFITKAQKDMDTKAASKIKDLEDRVTGLWGKIQIMKPLVSSGTRSMSLVKSETLLTVSSIELVVRSATATITAFFARSTRDRMLSATWTNTKKDTMLDSVVMQLLIP